MALYGWSRIRAGVPLLQGSAALDAYWMTYLTMLVLGFALGLAALIL
jgi:hypothetical protein